MRKWHRFLPAATSVSAIAIAVEVLSAAQKW